MRFMKHTLLLPGLLRYPWMAGPGGDPRQTNAIGGTTIDSTIVEDVPDIVTKSAKPCGSLVRAAS